MARFDDVRRWAAVRTGGIVRLLLIAEGHLVDVEGAVDLGDRDLAATFARPLVLQLLSVVSLREGGQIEHRYFDPNFDWFENVDPDLVARAMALAVEPLDEDVWDGERWLRAIRALVLEVESLLELEEPLPRLRSPETMFAGLAVARKWMELSGQLGVPLAALS